MLLPTNVNHITPGPTGNRSPVITPGPTGRLPKSSGFSLLSHRPQRNHGFHGFQRISRIL